MPADLTLLALKRKHAQAARLGDADRVKALEARIADLEDTPEPVALVDEEIDEGWAAYTKDELIEELRNRDLPVSGNKDELVDRLNESDQE